MLRTELIAPIPELLRRHASERGGKTAYRDANGAVTYSRNSPNAPAGLPATSPITA